MNEVIEIRYENFHLLKAKSKYMPFITSTCSHIFNGTSFFLILVLNLVTKPSSLLQCMNSKEKRV